MTADKKTWIVTDREGYEFRHQSEQVLTIDGELHLFDGTLHTTDDSLNVVAVYAPTQWSSIAQDDDRTFWIKLAEGHSVHDVVGLIESNGYKVAS